MWSTNIHRRNEDRQIQCDSNNIISIVRAMLDGRIDFQITERMNEINTQPQAACRTGSPAHPLPTFVFQQSNRPCCVGSDELIFTR